MDITRNNLVALLEECLVNGDMGIDPLWAWFCAERGLIKDTVIEARYEDNE